MKKLALKWCVLTIIFSLTGCAHLFPFMKQAGHAGKKVVKVTEHFDERR